MRSLQKRVAAVQRISLAVLLDGLALEVLAGRAPTLIGVPAGGVLIDVVTEEDEGVDVALLDEFAIGGVVPLLPVLTRGERESEPLGCRAGRGEGVRTRRGGLEAVEHEPIVVLGVGGEPGGVDVDRVAERGTCDPTPLATTSFISASVATSHLDVDIADFVRERVGREQASPQDDRISQRVDRMRRRA